MPHSPSRSRSSIAIIIAFYLMVAGGITTIHLFPKITTAVPSPLVAIVAIGGAAALFGLVVPTVGDMGELPSALPGLSLPDVPLSLGTLGIIAPVSPTLAVVGLLESLLTAQLMDDMTDESSDTGRESRGQALANVAAIPMAALVAVMIVVAVTTFDWASTKPAVLRRNPRSETAVMVVTVAIVVFTHNLAIGVLSGVLLSAIFFARRVAHLVEVTDVVDPDHNVRIYHVTGELFFASTNELVHAFDYFEEMPNVLIDLSDAHIWDSSAVAVLDTVVDRFERHGTHAEITGLNEQSTAMHDRLSGHLAPGH